jgi:hypothetical protein
MFAPQQSLRAIISPHARSLFRHREKQRKYHLRKHTTSDPARSPKTVPICRNKSNNRPVCKCHLGETIESSMNIFRPDEMSKFW